MSPTDIERALELVPHSETAGLEELGFHGQAKDVANWWHAETTYGAGLFTTREVAFDRGKGATLIGSDGKRYLDAAAAYGVVSLGHADPELVAAIAEQAARQIACTPSYTNEARALYLQELHAALPGDLERIFLCNSGTESVEAALKFARATHPERPGVLACMRGFHGRTMGALATTWEKHYRDPFAPLVPGVTHVPYGNIERIEAAMIDDTLEWPIGAVILEVIQGEGGVHAGDAQFLQAVEALCRHHGVLLIVDEVQTGFGRTGELFAVNFAGITPDLLCLGKGIAGGLPMGAVAMGPRVAALAPGMHGSTFGGNPLACAAARVVLRRLQSGLLESSAEVGAHLMQTLRELDHPMIREVRGRGLMIGVEFKQPIKPLMDALLEHGVVALVAGPRVLRLLPPLVITREQADTLVAVIAEALEHVFPRSNEA